MKNRNAKIIALFERAAACYEEALQLRQRAYEIAAGELPVRRPNVRRPRIDDEYAFYEGTYREEDYDLDRDGVDPDEEDERAFTRVLMEQSDEKCREALALRMEALSLASADGSDADDQPSRDTAAVENRRPAATNAKKGKDGPKTEKPAKPGKKGDWRL